MQNEDAVVDIIIFTIKRLSGYDFENYNRSSFKRRLVFFQTQFGLASLADIVDLLLQDDTQVLNLVAALSVTVTEIFREPEFYKAFREDIIPTLLTYPSLKIWHAGCASGEEPYSMAILLHEHELLAKAQIIATDINYQSIQQAKEGIYSQESFEKSIINYLAINPRQQLMDYFICRYNKAKVQAFLQKNIFFTTHDLVNDAVFGSMEVVVCRNVLIYFNLQLKRDVLDMFYQSLVDFGYLCLGAKEYIDQHPGFKVINDHVGIYQKVPYERN